MIAFAHGIHVDRDGNVWVTDANDNRVRPARGAAAGAPPPAQPAKLVGHQVIKFSPDGKVLMTLGKAGRRRQSARGADGAERRRHGAERRHLRRRRTQRPEPECGARHGGAHLEIHEGRTFVKSWGKLGSAPGEFRTPHGLAFDSRGRLFVADRGNVRLQIFDQDGKFLEETKAFSRLSGIYIDKNDTLYGADSESSLTSHPGGWKRGIRIGSAKDLKVTTLIPDPENPDPAKTTAGTSAAEGVAVDSQGNIYGAEVGPKAVKKYVKKAT